MSSIPHLAMFGIVGYAALPQYKPGVALAWVVFQLALNWAHGEKA